MSRVPNHLRTVILDSTGETSRQKWGGQFKVKAVMTNADRFALERKFADLMPKNTDHVTDMIKYKAATIAELSVKIVSGPRWWDDTDRGELMVDFDPLLDLLIKCNEATKDWNEELEKMVENK